MTFLGPGGLDDMGRHFNCTGGVSGSIDRQVFGDHLLRHPDCQKVYENTVYFDPEGCLVGSNFFWGVNWFFFRDSRDFNLNFDCVLGGAGGQDFKHLPKRQGQGD